MTKNEEVTDAYLQDITPEFEASLTEEDKTFETTVMISLEALGVLEQLKEATEVCIFTINLYFCFLFYGFLNVGISLSYRWSYCIVWFFFYLLESGVIFYLN